MYVRKCIECGKYFTTPSARLKICSDKCQRLRSAKRNKEHYKTVSAQKTKIKYSRNETTKVCIQCGKDFTTLHNSRKYCSEECRIKANKKSPLGRRTFTCEFCGESFEADAKRKFCCIECRQGAERAARLRRKPKKPKLSIANINELARNEGLNYGQYVAKYGL